MEGKRKATGPPLAEGEQRNAKRVKASGAVEALEETPEKTTDLGLKFVESLRNAKDKTGRPVATEFLTLPDRSELPEYYQEIKLPVAIDTIEEKLHRREYPTLTHLESDVKRMVVNAKQFNDKKSAIYEDAERVRKTASNFFTKHNPSYRDPTYSAVATPIPGEVNGTAPPQPRPRPSVHSEARSTPVKVQESATASPAPSMAKTKSADAGADTSGDKGDSSDFVGKTFMQAQDKIIDELIHHTDDDSDLEIFTPFVHLPTRKLVDYYQVIKHPVSLLGIQKRVRGVHGRASPTWVTDFQSWASFEEEVRFIWKNAREYNEDGSEIFELASELEILFNKRLADAKAVVEQPPQQKVTIKMPPKRSIRLTMNRGAQSPSTASRPSTPAQERSTPGVIVDNEALARQRQMVAAGIGGQAASTAANAPAAPGRNPFSGSRSGSASTPIPTLNSRYSDPRGMSAPSPPVHTNGVKNEVSAAPSPAYATLRPAQPGHVAQSAMPPPNGLTPRPASGSPHPPGPTAYHPPPHQYHPPPSYHGPLQGLVENKIRPAGQNAASSIMPSIAISTHPQLGLPKPYRFKIPASNTQTQQSITITVPSTHYYLQVVPHIPVALTGRPYRVFVVVNNTRQSEFIKPGAERDKTRPLFEARLERGGVNRIEVEILAGKEKKNASGKEEVELERCTIFVHVLKT